MDRTLDPAGGLRIDALAGDAALAHDGAHPPAVPVLQLVVCQVVGDVLAALGARDRIGTDDEVGEQAAVVDHPVERVVVGLVAHRSWTPEFVGDPHDLSNHPARKIGEAPITRLAGADYVAYSADRFFQGCAVINRMQIPNVEIVGLQSVQAGINRPHHPFAGQPLMVWQRATAVTYLGC